MRCMPLISYCTSPGPPPPNSLAIAIAPVAVADIRRPWCTRLMPPLRRRRKRTRPPWRFHLGTPLPWRRRRPKRASLLRGATEEKVQQLQGGNIPQAQGCKGCHSGKEGQAACHQSSQGLVAQCVATTTGSLPIPPPRNPDTTNPLAQISVEVRNWH